MERQKKSCSCFSIFSKKPRSIKSQVEENPQQIRSSIINFSLHPHDQSNSLSSSQKVQSSIPFSNTLTSSLSRTHLLLSQSNFRESSVKAVGSEKNLNEAEFFGSKQSFKIQEQAEEQSLNIEENERNQLKKSLERGSVNPEEVEREIKGVNIDQVKKELTKPVDLSKRKAKKGQKNELIPASNPYRKKTASCEDFYKLLDTQFNEKKREKKAKKLEEFKVFPLNTVQHPLVSLEEPVYKLQPETFLIESALNKQEAPVFFKVSQSPSPVQKIFENPSNRSPFPRLLKVKDSAKKSFHQISSKIPDKKLCQEDKEKNYPSNPSFRLSQKPLKLGKKKLAKINPIFFKNLLINKKDSKSISISNSLEKAKEKITEKTGCKLFCNESKSPDPFSSHKSQLLSLKISPIRNNLSIDDYSDLISFIKSSPIENPGKKARLPNLKPVTPYYKYNKRLRTKSKL